MKGLLLKDWFVIYHQCKYQLLVPVVFLFVSAFGEGGSFFAAFGTLMLAMLPMTVMGMDERSKWEIYALTMPYSRKDLVISKYVLGLIGLVCGTALHLLLTLIGKAVGASGITAALSTLLCLISGGLYISFAFPVLFRFGVEKGRLWLLAFAAAIACIGGALFSRPESDGFRLSETDLSALSVPVLGLLILLIAVSAWISVSFYNRKEF